MKSHDIGPGPLKRCWITGSEDLNLVIDLGHQPPCAALLDDKTIDQPEKTYPLRLMHCPESGLAQLDYVVDGSEIYAPQYPYRSGISKPVVEAQDELAGKLEGLFEPDFVVDIGSNDGTLLAAFARRGVRVLGVEPSDVAKIAEQENRVRTIQAFFTEELARQIVKDDGPADLITMTHVFAHMATLGEVMRGIEVLLADDGVLVIENHYLMELMAKNQFDSIYHEHLRTYSLKSLCCLFEQYGMRVFYVERAERYGGNIRAFVCRKKSREQEQIVRDVLAHEDRMGLHEAASWKAFRERVYEQRDLFMEFLHMVRRSGKSIRGVSAPGRATPLINFYGITPDMIPWTGELLDSLKLGKYVPGRHIKVVPNTRILEEQPDYLVLFSWHYAPFIQKRLRAEGVKSKLVVPLPNFKVLDE